MIPNPATRRLASEIRGARRDGEAQIYARLREVDPKLLEDEELV